MSQISKWQKSKFFEYTFLLSLTCLAILLPNSSEFERYRSVLLSLIPITYYLLKIWFPDRVHPFVDFRSDLFYTRARTLSVIGSLIGLIPFVYKALVYVFSILELNQPFLFTLVFVSGLLCLVLFVFSDLNIKRGDDATENYLNEEYPNAKRRRDKEDVFTSVVFSRLGCTGLLAIFLAVLVTATWELKPSETNINPTFPPPNTPVPDTDPTEVLLIPGMVIENQLGKRLIVTEITTELCQTELFGIIRPEYQHVIKFISNMRNDVEKFSVCLSYEDSGIYEDYLHGITLRSVAKGERELEVYIKIWGKWIVLSQ